MNLGLAELVLLVVAWGSVGVIHLVVAVAMKKGHQKIPKMFWLAYGIPTSYTVACLISPPDLISSLVFAVPCVGLYIAFVGIAVFLIGRNSDCNCEQAA